MVSKRKSSNCYKLTGKLTRCVMTIKNVTYTSGGGADETGAAQ